MGAEMRPFSFRKVFEMSKSDSIDNYPYIVFTENDNIVYSKDETHYEPVSGTISITENGEGIDIAQYAYADVNVGGGVEIGNLILVVQSSVIPAVGDDDYTTSIISMDSIFESLALGNSDILAGDSNNNFGMMPVGSNMTVGNFTGEVKVYDCTDDENWQYDSVTEVTGKVTYNENSTATIEIPSVDDGHFVVIYITPK